MSQQSRRIDPELVAEKVLTDKEARAFAIKIGFLSFLLGFLAAFLSLYFSDVDPWSVFGKSITTAFFAFFVGFYGTLFSVIIRKGDDDDGKGKADREAPASGGEDRPEAEAETAQ